MSSDNGIYILHTKTMFDKSSKYGQTRRKKPKDVWRVAHAMAIDNLDWYSANQPENVGAYLREIWGKSEVFYTVEEAATAALTMLSQQSKAGPVEYGINVIELPDLTFFGD